MTRTLVIGGGLSGLACAHELRRRGSDVLLLEKADRAGGVVGTVEVDGFCFETGPHTLMPSARSFRELAGELGIANRLIASSPAARSRFLWFRGRLVAVPTGPMSFLTTPLLSFGAKLRLLTEPLRRRPPEVEGTPEPSLAEFLEERLGREPTRRLAGAFVRGVYAGDLDRLGAESAFPRLWNLAANHGGLFRGFRAERKAKRHAARAAPLPGPDIPRGRLISFPGGLQELTDALARVLDDGLRTGAHVDAIEPTDDGWRVRLRGGEVFDGGALVLALPAPSAAHLLAPLEVPAECLSTLRGIEHAEISVVHLGFGPDLPAPPSGFGYLVPPGETNAPRVLGTIFSSNLFPGRAPDGAFAVACFYRSSDLPDDSDAIVRVACEDLAQAAGWTTTPTPRAVHIIDWKDVIPQYAPGHAERVTRLRAQLTSSLAGLHLAGSYVGGVSVDDVLATGRAVGAHCAESGARRSVVR